MLNTIKHPKITVNEDCVLSQDSYYTRNPEYSNIPGAIGPDSPEKIFVKSIQLVEYKDTEDGDNWFHAKIEHNGIWEIYTDTAVGPFVELKLQEHGIETSHCDFSEQGMQQDGLADFDIVMKEVA